MANYTVTPEDDYDVLIQDDPDHEEREPGGAHHTDLLSAQQVLGFGSTVFVVGLLGNVLLLCILERSKGLKRVGNIYLLNLALGSLCFLLPLPFWAHAAGQGESPGIVTCKVLLGFQSAGLHGQVLFSILLVAHGYQMFPHSRCLSSALRTVSGSVVTSVLAWIVAILVALPESVFYKPQMERLASACAFSRPPFLRAGEPSWKHLLAVKMTVLVLVLPAAVFTFCCLRMRKARSFGEQQYRLCKLAFLIEGVFLLMWAPHGVVLLLAAFQEHEALQGHTDSKLDAGVQITKIIATTHGCVNPLLYLLFEWTFRNYVCSLCPRIGPRADRTRAASQKGSHDQSTWL